MKAFDGKKETYEKPYIKIEFFSTRDMILTSGPTDGGIDDDGREWGGMNWF